MVDSSVNHDNESLGKSCDTEVCKLGSDVNQPFKISALSIIKCPLVGKDFCHRCIIQQQSKFVGVIFNKPCTLSSLLLTYQQVIKYQKNSWVPKGYVSNSIKKRAVSPLHPLRINLEYILSLFLKIETNEVQKMLSWCINDIDTTNSISIHF